MVRNNIGKIKSDFNKGSARFSPMTENNTVNPMMEVNAAGDEANDFGIAYTLYVFNLPLSTEESTLWKLFGPFGAIKNVTVMRNPTTNMCKGFAFVTMKNLDEATLAIETLNGYTLEDRNISVSFKTNKKRSDPTSSNIDETGAYSLYIFNLAPTTEDTALWKLFAQFGGVKNVKVMKDPVSKRSKGYAFVTMKNFEEANIAIKVLNGFSLDSRTIQVSFKTNKLKSEGHEIQSISGGSYDEYGGHVGFSEAGGEMAPPVNIYVNNLGPNTDESSLYKLFRQFGTIKNVKVIKDTTTNLAKGYAFVSMQDYDEASIAIKTLDGFTLEDRVLRVSFKTKKG